MGTDPREPPAPPEPPAGQPVPAQPSSIETASERLDAFLKRQRDQSSSAARTAADEPEADADEARATDMPIDGDGGGGSGDNTAPGVRPRAPRWLTLALLLVAAVAIGEGLYIAWHLGGDPAAPTRPEAQAAADAPAAPRGQDEPPAPQPPAGDAAGRDEGPAAAAGAARSEDEGAEADPGGAATGTIEVWTTPPGATVVFGGERRGVTPLTIEEVAPGLHEIEVGGWFGSRSQPITVRPGAVTRVELEVPPRRDGAAP